MSPLPQLAPLDASEASTASDLHALLQAAYTQEAQLLELDAAQFPPLQRRVHELQTSDEAWIGAWQAGELVGALSLHADGDDEAVTCIGALVVHPAQQRRGIATLLLHAAFSSQGAHTPFSVQTAQANAPALALYREAGFKEWRRWAQDVGGQRLKLIKLLRRGNRP